MVAMEKIEGALTGIVRLTARYSITQRRHSDRNGNLIKGLVNPLLFLDKRWLPSVAFDM